MGWTVFADTVKISQGQADSINAWNAQLTENNRKTLPLGTREVTYYDISSSDETSDSSDDASDSSDETSDSPYDYTMYIVVGVVGILILVGLFMFMRSRKSQKETPQNDAEGQPLK